jgi:hypothetical protein
MAIAEPIAMGGDVSNGGQGGIEMSAPYRVLVQITGDTPMLFHRYQVDVVETSTAAARGSKAKTTEDPENYVWRNDEGIICLPGEYLRCSMSSNNGAAKYQTDPRSPRKSALDLYKASIVPLTRLAPITRADGELAEAWDYVDKRRVVIRGAVPRTRPAFNAGWHAEIELMVLTPEYIDPRSLHRTLNDAGRLVGIADFRPTFGRFSVTHYEVLKN